MSKESRKAAWGGREEMMTSFEGLFGIKLAASDDIRDWLFDIFIIQHCEDETFFPSGSGI